LQFFAEVDHDISRMVSVYSKEILSLEVEAVKLDEKTLYGVVIGDEHDAVDNIVSIANSHGVEIYNTSEANGTFSSRTIYLPSDCVSGPGDEVVVHYNKIEFFDLSGGDGAFFDKTITLPSADILRTNDAYDSAKHASDYALNIYVKYIGVVSDTAPSCDFSLLPMSGSETSRSLFDSNLSSIDGSNQPIFFEYNADGTENYIARFGPSRLNVTTSNTSKSGKIQVSGTTLSRIEVDLIVGNYMSGFKVDLSDAIRDYFGEDYVPSNVGIAKVDLVEYNGSVYDLLGYNILENKYNIGVAGVDSELERYKFTLPSTVNNLSMNPSSGEIGRASCRERVWLKV
jgi:hypothetical protein